MVELLAGEKQDRETKKAIQACNDYLRMGPGRSLQKLHQIYIESTSDIPLTKHLRTLAEWSRNYNWQARANAYDTEIEQQKNEATAQRRKEALESGLALDFERIIKLNGFFAKLENELEENGLYYTDLKVSAKGDVVEVPTFNKVLIDELRGLLDDIAKEMGGRSNKFDVKIDKELDKILDILENGLSQEEYVKALEALSDGLGRKG